MIGTITAKAMASPATKTNPTRKAVQVECPFDSIIVISNQVYPKWPSLERKTGRLRQSMI
jgi:hypothetical protein